MNNVSAASPDVNPDPPDSFSIDDFRPTAGPEFLPSLGDEAEAVELLNTNTTDVWSSAWVDPWLGIDHWDFLANLAAFADRVALGIPWL